MTEPSLSTISKRYLFVAKQTKNLSWEPNGFFDAVNNLDFPDCKMWEGCTVIQ